jgi:hypothetical protein
LVNSSVTVGSTSIALGATSTTLAGLTSVGSNLLTSAASTALTLQSAGTTAITVDTSQKVGINTTSPNTGGNVTIKQSSSAYQLQLEQSNTTDNFSLRCDSSDGALTFSRYQSSAYTERMRLTLDGKVLVGTTNADNPTDGIVLYYAAQNSQVIIGHATGTPSGYIYTKFSYNASTIGSITQNGTTGVLYNLTSDYRLKNNPVALTGAKDFVMALQPKTWDWWDGSGKGVGFIAHEFMEVAKYSGQGEKDAVDADGNPIHQSIQPSSSEVMANMVALMQEQQATITAQTEAINALTARVVALEAK